MITIWVALFLLGAVHAVVAVFSVAALAGRRQVGADGRVRRRRGRGRVSLGLAGLVVTVALLAVELGWVYANQQFARIDRVEVAHVLAGSRRGTNYLLVGTDHREGANHNLADTIMVLRTGDGPARLMSLPRDLLVTIPGRDDGIHRINAAYNDGPDGLVRTVQESVGIPVDHYMEINFTSFGGLIDAIGGVTIEFPNPAYDVKSGLDIPHAGPVELDGNQALAYVRSRTYTEVIAGERVTDPSADLGRVQRQQAFLQAVLAQAGADRSLGALDRMGQALVGGLRVDEDMTLVDALRFAWTMGRLHPERVELPTTIVGPALELRQPDAAAVIAQFT